MSSLNTLANAALAMKLKEEMENSQREIEVLTKELASTPDGRRMLQNAGPLIDLGSPIAFGSQGVVDAATSQPGSGRATTLNPWAPEFRLTNSAVSVKQRATGAASNRSGAASTHITQNGIGASPDMCNVLSMSEVSEAMSKVAETLQNIAVKSNLPPLEVVKFTGDPSEYLKFKTRFHQMVVSYELSEEQKMSRLIQFLDGKGRAAVIAFEGVSGGLDKALRTLERRFGQPHIVAESCVHALTGGSTIASGDTPALQVFADKSVAVLETLTALNATGEMNLGNLGKMTRKLPTPLQYKWRDKVQRIRERGTIPQLADLVEFIVAAAEAASDPVFGKIGEPRKDQPKKQQTYDTKRERTTTSTMATGAQVVSGKCYDCGGEHSLRQCEQFKRKPQMERHAVVKTKGLCFNCLLKGHGVGACRAENKCSNCKGKHHTLLHRESNRNERAEKSTTVGLSAVVHTATGNKVKKGSAKVALQVVPVQIIGKRNRRIETYALLDSGSEESFVEDTLVKELNIPSKGTETLNICTLTGETSLNVKKCELTVSGVDNASCSTETVIIPVKVVPSLNISTTKVTDVSQWGHLKDLSLPSVDKGKISLLIGTNVPQVQVHHESRIGQEGQPIAVRTVFGWSVFGPVGNDQSSDKTQVNFMRNNSPSEVLEEMGQHLGFENVSTRGPMKIISQEDIKALEIMESTARKDSDRYEVAMLWRDKDVWLPNNRYAAEKRLGALTRKFLDEAYQRKYRSFMEMLITRGYARKLSPEEAETKGPMTWYLPHHGVVHPQKPEKLRVVFDAAAMHKGISLNNQLMHGPDLNNNLLGVLLRFRQGEVAVAGDVEKMFLQVKVTQEDMDSLRFLWWANEGDVRPQEYQMTRHIFGATDSPSCCSFILKRTADDCRGHFSEKAIESVKRQTYVDDYLPSFDCTAEAMDTIKEVTSILSTGGFHITSWISNSREVLASVPEGERAEPQLDLDLDSLPVQRALGVWWDTEGDIFQFNIVDRDRPLSKRGVLSTLSALFDPMGFVSPVVLEAKVIMQCLWKKEIDWDDPLPQEENERWEKWLTELSSLTDIKIPRQYQIGGIQASDSETSLHCFSDASEYGYGMCAYLRFVYIDGTISCKFVIGRSRCAPVKVTSIPRLELQAAVLSARVGSVILEELTMNIANTVFWTDSQTTLQYIQNDRKRFHTYVANRVSEIRQLTQVEQWRHCPGIQNPADDASRGLKPKGLAGDHRWFSGPSFLWDTESSWPETETQCLPDDNIEVKKTQVHVAATRIDEDADHKHVETGLHKLIEKAWSWSGLVRRVAWLVRFCEGLKQKKFKDGTLKQEELDEAVGLIMRFVQANNFEEDTVHLKSEGCVKGGSKLASLRPILVNGILRVGGRLNNAPTLSEEEKHPAILPSDHRVTFLIIQDAHRRLAHCGREHILSETRKKFWIIGGRTLAKQLVRKCILCRKGNARKMEQVMASLPEYRLVPYKPAFSFSGCDLFGPLQVKWGRSTAKRWGCLFTCLTTRSVFLEVTQSLSTDDFIMVLRQFVCRRGPPEEIHSDNGTNFTGAERELRESIQQWDQQKIDNSLQQQGIKWVFQTPTAAHMSGVWERLVKMAKRHLVALSGNRLLTDFGLRTLFAETEAIMNSRPLCSVSDDPQDFEPLTPNHFLLHRKVCGLPQGVFSKQDYLLRKEWRKIQYLLDLFWSRWLAEYIPKLQHRAKWRREQRNLMVGDLVLLAEDNVKRGQWPLGRVSEVYPGPDGVVQSALVKTADSEFKRPIAKMCLLEAADDVPRGDVSTIVPTGDG
jgi:hypothetical protein